MNDFLYLPYVYFCFFINDSLVDFRQQDVQEEKFAHTPRPLENKIFFFRV